ncbi:TPA: F0F1 ATP synthase subunit B [Pasteurella multocida]|uniref:ATP synthase subunit b n=2 Tax=Pasteurella multocida TaxID=747 RepID=ATPF_PASMU|nr:MULTISPECIES: F0F1 ATP synthase subunit B [Pasteurella]Q9CKW4.1 RecName: Full=ATP synthase subunit b; AltName: Full=ATP synthase F(0) sector subunit b; AltName: Full=ATPase subunit I; AltName: Full=F-type ATPase subunit b; Short=F-ATPase subunit b [Pasteurella multocida subsp. multocida str. Pm70]EGP04947.1 F0F1 ATP synthase subunit B [Pasteurella multocida subsp. gallicida str. Anand1_poultry]AAK03574.1 AtpF [Pasteurella multocida subsp. multocida str. Pm70]AFF24983.1 ATP synthase subunit B
MNLNATLIGQLIAFAIFVAFCMKFVWPPIIKAIEERQRSIANALASAEAARKEQADTKALVEQEITEAKMQAQQIIDLANKRRNEILEEVKVEAEATKAKIIEQGYAEVEAERKRVQEELRVKVASLAIAGAEKIVGRTVDEAANSDIIDKLVAEL